MFRAQRIVDITGEILEYNVTDVIFNECNNTFTINHIDPLAIGISKTVLINSSEKPYR
jgi:hypothetical protein